MSRISPQDTLEEKQPMPIVRFRAAMVNASNYVYFFGGRDLDDGLVSLEYAVKTP